MNLVIKIVKNVILINVLIVYQDIILKVVFQMIIIVIKNVHTIIILIIRNIIILKNNNCPEEYNLFIIDKKRCIDDWCKDNGYKYQYNNNCYKNCPQNTKTNESFCEPCEGGICSGSGPILNHVHTLIKNYNVNNNSCENNNVKMEENENYTIYIYIKIIIAHIINQLILENGIIQ